MINKIKTIFNNHENQKAKNNLKRREDD